MSHNLRVRSKSNSENSYRLEFSGGVEPESGIGGRDTVTDDGTACEGRVVSGVDSWTYWGAKGAKQATDPQDLELSINGGPWKPATAFGATPFGDGSSSGGGGGGDGQRAGGSNSGSDGTPSYQGTPDGVLSSDAEYEDFFGFSIPNTEELRVGVEGGTYNPPAIQRSILHARPEYSIQVLGTQNPYDTDISRANHNFTILCKDEHFWIEGMMWGRTQFSGAGDPYCKNMVFTDRKKGSSALGGKRGCGRFINCDIGHQNDPDEYAAFYYGGGTVLFDRANTFRATGDAYIGANNHVELHIGGSNEFASGDKEVVEGSGIYPSDLSDGMNVIQHGELR